MLLNVPVQYSANVRKKRHKNASDLLFWEHVDVVVPEFSDEEAPVAVGWNESMHDDLSYMQKDKWGTMPSDGVGETRWMDGSHWWPVLGDPDRDRFNADKLSPERLEEKCRDRQSEYNPLMMPFHTYNMPQEPYPLYPEEFGEVKATNREQRIEKAVEKARDLAIIEGRIWRRGAEPVFYVKEWLIIDGDPQGLIKVLPSDSPAIGDRKNMFRMDRFDEALAAAAPFGSRGENPNASLQPTVFIHEAFKVDDELMALGHTAQQLLSKFADKPIKNVSGEVAMAWHVLAAHFDDDGNLLTDGEQLQESVAAFSNALGDGDERNIAERALERWNSRPITAVNDYGL